MARDDLLAQPLVEHLHDGERLLAQQETTPMERPEGRILHDVADLADDEARLGQADILLAVAVADVDVSPAAGLGARGLGAAQGQPVVVEPALGVLR